MLRGGRGGVEGKCTNEAQVSFVMSPYKKHNFVKLSKPHDPEHMFHPGVIEVVNAERGTDRDRLRKT